MATTDSFEVLRQLRRLDSADPAERGRAIIYLGKIRDDSRVTDMLQYLADTDPDPRVRELAARAIRQQQQATGPGPVTPPEPSAPPPQARPRSPRQRPASGPPWRCKFCDTEGITAARCPNCGADRATGAASVIRPVKAAPRPPRPDPLAGDPFIFYPKNEKFVRGQTDHVRGYVTVPVLVGLLVGFVIAVALFLGVALPSWERAQDLDANGLKTEGTIDSRRVVIGDESDSHYVTYVFWAWETESHYKREQSVSYRTYRALPRGSEVEIKYLPDDPRTSKLLGDDTEDTGRMITLLIAVAAGAILLILFIIGLEYRARTGELMRKGRLLRGKVVSCQGRLDSDDDLTVTLRYTFHTPEGRRIEKTARRMANDLKGAALPRPGDPVVVLYLDDKNYKLM